MTRTETQQLLIKINACYPNWKPDDLTGIIDAWHEQLKDTTLETAEKLLDEHIKGDTGAYIPSVSALISKKRLIYGFQGRTYSHEFFEELDREAQEAWK